MRDPYSVLGVSRTTSTADIRKAYKKLARKLHPDVAKSKADTERFKDVNAAYDVLGDDDRRELFDEFGEVSTKPGFDASRARAWSRQGDGLGGGFPGGGTPGGGFRWSTGDPDLGGGFGGGGGGGQAQDIFGSIFGGGRRARRGPRPGQDISTDVTVSLLAVAKGEAIELTVRRPVVAETGGPGRLSMQSEQLKVRLPPAVEDGQAIRLRGKGGESASGGPAGDLLITVRVGPSPGLSRDGQTLLLDVPITFSEALAGARIAVPTLDGDVKVTVPAGVSQGQRMRLRGKGMKLKDGRGDLMLVMRPTPPTDLSEEQTEAAGALAEQLAALYGDDVRKGVIL